MTTNLEACPRNGFTGVHVPIVSKITQARVCRYCGIDMKTRRKRGEAAAEKAAEELTALPAHEWAEPCASHLEGQHDAYALAHSGRVFCRHCGAEARLIRPPARPTAAEFDRALQAHGIIPAYVPIPDAPEPRDALTSRAVGVDEPSIESDFWTFHEQHPAVYAEIVRLCREWRGRGRERWSIDGAFEVIRWQRRLAGLPDDREAYKLNNNYRSRYARLVMDREPDLEGIFEVRVLRPSE